MGNVEARHGTSLLLSGNLVLSDANDNHNFYGIFIFLSNKKNSTFAVLYKR